MITKITLDKVASYKNATSLETDKKVNLIYGLNGTGKTTLADYLYSLSDSSFSNCSVEGLNAEELLVYSKRFIHDYFFQPDSLKGIFTLSKENKEAAEKVKNAKIEIVKLDKQKTDEITKKEKLESSFNDKTKVVEEKVWEIKTNYAGGDRVLEYCLEGVKGNKQSLFNKLLKISLPETKPPETIEVLKKDVEAIQGNTPTRYDLFQEIKPLQQNIEDNSLLQKQIVGNDNSSVAELIKKLENSDWIKSGISYLPKTSGKCPFCQQDITAEITNNIKDFFDEAYENDIRELTNLQAKYNASLDEIPSKNVYENNPFISDNKNEFGNLYDILINCLKSNQAKIQKKLSTPSQSITLENSSKSIENFNAFIIKINKKISEYNQKIDNKEKILKNIMTKFWEITRWDYDQTISAYLEEKTSITQSTKTISEEIDTIAKSIKAQNEIILTAQKNTVNIEEAINNINSRLIEFGIDAFTIEKCNNDLYQIKRTEKCDFKTLSESEKMIISFLYFCELCKGKKTAESQSTKKIVVIDDPISSLSHIWVFNVGQLIREEFFKSDNYEQIFVLTHNLYFFYELTNVMHVKKQEQLEKSKKLKLFRIIKNVNGSSILPMEYNEVKNDYQSYWAIINDKTNQHPVLIANCMRNVLEYFFGFVRNIELDDIFKKTPFQDVKYQSFLRYMNSKSHSTGRNIFDISELNYDNFRDAFKLVFTESGYTEHYEIMSE
jgi:wobble nucleotide-excising tRNase